MASSDPMRSRRRFGSLRRLGSGRFQASYSGPDGERYVAPATFATRVEAERWLAGIEIEIVRGPWRDPALGQASLSWWAGEWLAGSSELKEKTVEGYESILSNHVIRAFGEVAVRDIDYLAVRRFIAELRAKGLSAKTVSNIREVLHLVLQCATLAGAIPANPVVNVAVGRFARRELTVLDTEQIRRLADAIAEPAMRRGGGEHRRSHYPEYSLLVRLDAWTGLRAGEIGALRRGRIDLAGRRVHVAESVTEVHGKLVYGPTKTYERRSASLLPALVADLEQHLATIDDDPDTLVFRAPNGGPLRHKTFYSRHFKPAVVAAGLPPALRFHDLRHSFAGLLIATGAHPRAIMERMGHSSITVTLDTYGHLLPRIDEKLTAELDELYRRGVVSGCD